MEQLILLNSLTLTAVSYTHLDVYKRQDYNVGVRTGGGLVVIDGSYYFISIDYLIAKANNFVYEFLEGTKVLSKTQIDSTKIKKKQMRSR